MKVKRHQMPQIPSDQVGKFEEFCRDRGISVESIGIHPSHIHPVQSEVNKDKIQKLMDDANGEWSSILVGSGTKEPEPGNTQVFVLDGLHRFVAQKTLHPDSNINCIWFHCPMAKLIRLAHEFEGSFTKSVHEITTYKQLALALWRLV